MSVKILHYDDVDITGFAGIRERLLVMDSKQFGLKTIEGTWQGLGQLVYLAHAFFMPHGETRKHFHSDMDIVSIVTRGEIFHEGTLGDGETVSAGQVQIQCSGSNGFYHNEVNPLADISGMVQIWMQPSEKTKMHSAHRVLNIQPGFNLLMDEGQTRLSVLRFDQAHEWADARNDREHLVYIFEGDANVYCHETQTTLLAPRGSLIKGKQFSLMNERACCWLWAHETP